MEITLDPERMSATELCLRLQGGEPAVALDPGLSWDTSQLNIDGTIAIVPEPSGWVLVLLGVIGLVLWRRPPSKFPGLS